MQKHPYKLKRQHKSIETCDKQKQQTVYTKESGTESSEIPKSNVKKSHLLLLIDRVYLSIMMFDTVSVYQ